MDSGITVKMFPWRSLYQVPLNGSIFLAGTAIQKRLSTIMPLLLSLRWWEPFPFLGVAAAN
jgi:hypothetical protein